MIWNLDIFSSIDLERHAQILFSLLWKTLIDAAPPGRKRIVRSTNRTCRSDLSENEARSGSDTTNDTSRSVFTTPRWNPTVVLLEPCARNQEPVAFDQWSRPRSKSPHSLEPRDTSFYKLLRSRSCCLFSHTAGATQDSRELSCTRNPIVIPACNFNQSRYVESTSRLPSLPTDSRLYCWRCCPVTGLSALSCTWELYMDPDGVRRRSTPGTCDVKSSAPRVRSIIHRPIVRRSTPAAYGTTSPAIGFPRLKASRPSLSVRFPDTHTLTHSRYPMLDMLQ